VIILLYDRTFLYVCKKF